MCAKEVNPRLGRGLAALMGDTDAQPSRSTTGASTLPIEMLEPGPFQPRGTINPQHLTDLIDSIRSRGVLQPLLVRPRPGAPGHYQIIAGERRWRASQAAGLHEVPVLIRDFEDSEAMAAALVENLQRQDLNAIEEADGYRRLLEEFAMTQEKLAEAVGKSRSHVANTMRLLNLPATVQAEVKSGALTAGHARALLGHPEPAKAALAVISRGLSVRQTEALIGQLTKGEGGRATVKKPVDPETAALERDMSQRLGLKVEIGFDGEGGAVRIHYQSLDQLDGIITLLSRES